MSALLHIKVKPRSARASHQLAQGEWLIRVSPPAVEGQANRAVLEYLSEILRIPRTSLAVQRGENQPHKVIVIEGLTEAEVWQRLSGS